jgi:nitrilase
MPSFDTIRVAAIQATPVILDGEASVAKAVELIGDAAAEGAQLAVLPETFVPLYPSNSWARQSASFSGSDAIWERLWQNSVDVPGPLVDRLVDACRQHGAHVAIGVNERESERPGSLYNTLLLLGADGVELKHRKLVPTHQERLFHAFGAGDDLNVARARRWGASAGWCAGKPHAARSLGSLPPGPADLGRAHGR